MGEIYKGSILLQKGDLSDGLLLINNTIQTSRNNENWIHEFGATSVKAGLLYKLNEFGDAKKTVEQAELLLNLVSKKTIKTDYWEGLLVFTKGLLYQNESLFEKSLPELITSLQLFQKYKNYYFILELLSTVGTVYQELGQYNLALSYYHEKLGLINIDKVEEKELYLLHDSIGRIYLEKGQYDLALYYLNLALNSVMDLNYQTEIGKIKQLMGKIHINIGNFDLAFSYFKKSIDIHNEVGDVKESGWTSLQVAFANYKKGNLSLALSSYETCLKNFEQLDDKLMSAWTLKSIGEIYVLKGEYKIALDYFQQNIKILSNLDNKYGLADGLNKIGKVYHNKGDLKTALDNFQRSLSMYIKIGDDFDSVDTLFNLIQIKLEMNSLKQAKYFLKMLSNISDKTQDQHIKLKFNLAKALVHKNHSRIVEKIKAQKIFDEIVNSDIIDHELSVMANLNLCDLLIAELWSYQEGEVLDELKYHLAELYEIAQEQKSFNLLVEVLLLQAKFSLIEGDANAAMKQLNQAEITVIDYDLHHLDVKVQYQQEELKAKLNLWDELNRRNASIRERIELADMDGYIDRVFKVQDNE